MFSEDFPKTRNQTFNFISGVSSKFTNHVKRNSSISGKIPKPVSVLIDIQGLRARRSVAKTRAKRSTHPRRTIRVREIAAPARTCNQRFKDLLRRSDRPTNSRPSFPEVEAKPRPAPNIRSRSSPAGCAAASSNPDSTNPFAGFDQRRSIKVSCPRFRIRPKTGSIAEDSSVNKGLHRASVVLTSFDPVPIYYRTSIQTLNPNYVVFLVIANPSRVRIWRTTGTFGSTSSSRASKTAERVGKKSDVEHNWERRKGAQRIHIEQPRK